MDPATIEIILAAIRLGTAALNQVSLMDLDSLPPEVRTALLKARDDHNDAWAKLAPRDA